jgi:hypothetical protein
MNYLATVTIQHIQVIREKDVVTRMAQIKLNKSDPRIHNVMDRMDAIMKYFQAMCTVSLKLAVLLTRVNPAFTIKYGLYVEERAYNHRFSVFLKQQIPAPLPYEEYESIKAQLERCDITVLIQSCLESIETAKSVADHCKKCNPQMTQVLEIDVGSTECQTSLCCQSFDSHHCELERRTITLARARIQVPSHLHECITKE